LGTVTDVFQNAAKRYLADFPTRAERLHFLETARKLLAYDDAFNKTLPGRKRRALMNGPIETDAQEQEVLDWLMLAIKRITKQAGDYSDEVLGRRAARLALLILEGLSNPDICKVELIVLERDLHDLYNATTAAQQRDKGKDARQKHLDTKQANDERLQRLVVRARNSLKNPPKSQNARARLTLLRIPSRDRIWNSTPAFIKWARRRKIVI
jgi:hypothetical protein